MKNAFDPSDENGFAPLHLCVESSSASLHLCPSAVISSLPLWAIFNGAM
jgi:hypothetical protein